MCTSVCVHVVQIWLTAFEPKHSLMNTQQYAGCVCVHVCVFKCVCACVYLCRWLQLCLKHSRYLKKESGSPSRRAGLSPRQRQRAGRRINLCIRWSTGLRVTLQPQSAPHQDADTFGDTSRRLLCIWTDGEWWKVTSKEQLCLAEVQ